MALLLLLLNHKYALWGIGCLCFGFGATLGTFFFLQLQEPPNVWEWDMHTLLGKRPICHVQRCLQPNPEQNVVPELSHTSMSAYYQTSGKHQAAIHLVLMLFRRSYPYAPLTLFYDGSGAELEFMQTVAHTYAANLSYTKVGAHPQGPFKGTFFKVENAKEYVQRIHDAAAYGATWLMLLEDDAWVCQPVQLERLHYDMNGVCQPMGPPLAPFLRPLFGEERTRCYGGAGGTVLRTSRLLLLPKTTHHNATGLSPVGAFLDALFEKATTTTNATREYLASDVILSAVVIHAGGTIGRMYGYADGMRDQTKPLIVRHQMKQLYTTTYA